MDEDQKRMAEELLFSNQAKASFAKRLFFGHFDNEQILPYPNLNDSEINKNNEFIAKLKDYAEKNINPDKIDREEKIPEEVISGLGELGVLGMTVPKQYGGLDMSQNAYCQAIEVIASRCGGTAVFTNAHQSIGLKGILLFGTKEQKDKYLPSLATGKKVSAFSLTEPNAGSDAAGVETTAIYDEQKKVYRINGQKQWTTNGSIAQVLTVMAKTEVKTERGIEEKVTAFLVEPSMKGFKVTNPGLEKVGIRGTRTTNLEFTDLEVPKENILGPLGGGLRVCLTCLDYGRTTFGAMCTGAARYTVQRAIDHAMTRRQFNRPLSSFSLVKKKIAEMSALVYAMDASTYLTAGMIDAGEEDVMLEAAILKVFASDALWDILYDTMQIFGGRSFFTSEPFERMMRDARLNMIGEGSNEVLRAFIGLVGMRDVGMSLKAVSDASKKPIKNFSSLFKFFLNTIKQLRSPKIHIRSKHLQKEATQLSKEVRSFGLSIIKQLAKHKEDIVEKQLVLNRITNCVIALFTISAVISKLDTALNLNNDDPKKVGKDFSIGKLYCKMAFKKIRDNKNSLKENLDSDIESVAEIIAGK
ncbi:MAG: acyl-CoA dehydrogenase family protein [Chlamydiota bacterium]|nr:acyl-CoA dehydrogenase family protein [Chlamydiota bacterium]